jgi:hypothetical protein
MFGDNLKSSSTFFAKSWETIFHNEKNWNEIANRKIRIVFEISSHTSAYTGWKSIGLGPWCLFSFFQSSWFKSSENYQGGFTGSVSFYRVDRLGWFRFHQVIKVLFYQHFKHVIKNGFDFFQNLEKDRLIESLKRQLSESQMSNSQKSSQAAAEAVSSIFLN